MFEFSPTFFIAFSYFLLVRYWSPVCSRISKLFKASLSAAEKWRSVLQIPIRIACLQNFWSLVENTTAGSQRSSHGFKKYWRLINMDLEKNGNYNSSSEEHLRNLNTVPVVSIYVKYLLSISWLRPFKA